MPSGSKISCGRIGDRILIKRPEPHGNEYPVPDYPGNEYPVPDYPTTRCSGELGDRLVIWTRHAPSDPAERVAVTAFPSLVSGGILYAVLYKQEQCQ
jgi:hypothetical protein